MASASQISFRNLGRQSWASAPTPRGGTRGRHAGVVVPYGWLRRAAAIALGSGADGRNGWESRQRSPQKCPATPDNPSVGLWPTAPFAQGSLALRGTGDADCRVAALLAMTTVFCHSEASAHTGRGNPSFLRWTGVRAAVPRAWPPPTKFRTEIWGVGQVVGPYGRSTEVAATGRCGHRPLRMVAESCRDLLGSALSAERVAGQIRVLPDTLKVQHGVQGPEVSAKSRPCSRRGCVN